MEKLINNPIDFRKKISLNINIGILDLVRDLAKLTKTNNTLVIDSLLVKGVDPLIKQFKNSWTLLSIDTKDKKKKKHLKDILNKLKTISEKEKYRPLIGS